MAKHLVLAVGPVLKRELLPAIDRAAENLNWHRASRIEMAARNTAQAAEITFESLLFMECIDTNAVARLIRESVTGKNLARVFDWPEVLIGDAGIFWPAAQEN